MVCGQKKRIPILITAAAAYFTTWFFCCTFLYAQENLTSVEMFRDQLEHSVGIWLIFALLFCFLTALFYPFATGEKRVRRSSVLLGLVYAVLFTIGICQQCSENEDFFIPGTGRFFRLGLLAAWLLFFACCVEALNQKLDSMECPRGERTLSRRTFFVTAGALLLLWLPFVVLDYPGAVCYDTVQQFGQFWGMIPRSNNSPFFDTVVYGVLYGIGSFLGGSDNFGIGFIVICQLILYAASFAYAIETVCRVTGFRAPRWILIALYGLVPIFGGAVRVVLKDSLHLPFVMLYCTVLVRILYFPVTKKTRAAFCLTFMLAALTRKAALSYVLAGAVVLCLLAKKPDKRKLLLCTVLSVLLVLGVEKVLYPLLGIAEAPSSELVAFPIQSVSYITRRQLDYIPQELLQRIDAVLGIDNILTLYNPNNADYMKTCFSGDVKEILSVWFALAKRFPGEFVYSVITASWKYFFAFSTGSTEYWYGIDDFSKLGKEIAFVIPVRYIKNYVMFWVESPSLSRLIGPGPYSWMLLFSAGRAWRNKSKEILVLIVPMAILMIGLIFTPINGECRYAYPLIGMAPIILTWACCSGQKRNDPQSGNAAMGG